MVGSEIALPGDRLSLQNDVARLAERLIPPDGDTFYRQSVVGDRASSAISGSIAVTLLALMKDGTVPFLRHR